MCAVTNTDCDQTMCGSLRGPGQSVRNVTAYDNVKPFILAMQFGVASTWMYMHAHA